MREGDDMYASWEDVARAWQRENYRAFTDFGTATKAQPAARPDHTQLPLQYADLNGVYHITSMAA